MTILLDVSCMLNPGTQVELKLFPSVRVMIDLPVKRAQTNSLCEDLAQPVFGFKNHPFLVDQPNSVNLARQAVGEPFSYPHFQFSRFQLFPPLDRRTGLDFFDSMLILFSFHKRLPLAYKENGTSSIFGRRLERFSLIP